MTGPLALLGGSEHRESCRPIDRWLLDRTGAHRPLVAVIPAASLPGTRPATVALARNYWAALGARVVAVSPEAVGPAIEKVAQADQIVLTGGVPALLIRALATSPLWDAILDRRHEGAGLSGSSAGAMAMLAWRLRLVPPSPLGLVPGLGPLTGHVVVPHFDRFVLPLPVMRRLATRRQQSYAGDAVLGIDECTAYVSYEGDTQVLGAGSVTWVGPDSWTQVAAGGPVPLACVVAFPQPGSKGPDNSAIRLVDPPPMVGSARRPDQSSAGTRDNRRPA